MPLMRCQRDGQPGYKWGKSGKCYIYTPGDKQSRESAKALALQQRNAIYASGWKE